MPRTPCTWGLGLEVQSPDFSVVGFKLLETVPCHPSQAARRADVGRRAEADRHREPEQLPPDDTQQSLTHGHPSCDSTHRPHPHLGSHSTAHCSHQSPPIGPESHRGRKKQWGPTQGWVGNPDNPQPEGWGGRGTTPGLTEEAASVLTLPLPADPRTLQAGASCPPCGPPVYRRTEAA